MMRKIDPLLDSYLLCFFCFVLSVFLSGCSTSSHVPVHHPRGFLRFSQKASEYILPGQAGQHFFSVQESRILGTRYKKFHFGPWQKKQAALPFEELHRRQSMLGSGLFFNETKKKYSVEEIQTLQVRAYLDTYPNTNRHAITVAYASMRMLPTHRPAFLNFSLAGEGYPFDYLQITGIPPQAPVFVSHLSNDGVWAFCETRGLAGWLPVDKLAFVDEDFKDMVQKAPLIALMREGVAVQGDLKRFRFKSRVGMILPALVQEDGSYKAFIAMRDFLGMARLGFTEPLPGNMVQSFPLQATIGNIALLLDELMGRPYGWGGLYGHRDCSSTMQDIFAPFGLSLPRNSRDQAYFGRFISLKDFSSTEKKQIIRDQGRPWHTLLWRKGHILLFIGTNNQGEVLAVHTIWGLSTRKNGKEGRYLIGKTIISSLTLGQELGLFDEDNTLLGRLEGMAVLQPAGEKGSFHVQ